MLAARSRVRADHDDLWPPLPRPDPADWLTLQQTACELNVSVSTVRRRIRRGELRNRIVPRRGGFAYLVYVPDSRHARQLGVNGARAVLGAGHVCREPASIDDARRSKGRSAPADDADRDDEIRALRQQVDNLANALSRALRVKQRALPAGIGAPQVNHADPYARYRWLARRRRWWPF
jgi:hypothetical protein